MEDCYDIRWKEWTDFLEAVILLPNLFQEDGWRGSFLTRQGEFYNEVAVEFGVVNATDAVTLGTLCPTKVSTRRVEDGDEQRADTQGNGGSRFVVGEHGRCAYGHKPSDRREDDDGEVNEGASVRVEFFCPLMTP